MRRAIWQLASM
jgi:hypothetical protein